MSDDYKIETVFESEMTVGAEIPSSRLFDTALLNHIIQFHHESADDLRKDGRISKRLRYRVVVYVEEKGND